MLLFDKDLYENTCFASYSPAAMDRERAIFINTSARGKTFLTSGCLGQQPGEIRLDHLKLGNLSPNAFKCEST